MVWIRMVTGLWNKYMQLLSEVNYTGWAYIMYDFKSMQTLDISSGLHDRSCVGTALAVAPSMKWLTTIPSLSCRWLALGLHKLPGA